MTSKVRVTSDAKASICSCIEHWEIDHLADPEVSETNSGRTEASIRPFDDQSMTFPIRGVGEASSNIFLSQLRKIAHDFCFAHPGGQIVQDVRYRDAHPANARLAAALAGFDRDDVPIIHRL